MSSARRQLVVGVADCRVTADVCSDIVTYALGSCIAVSVYDPVVRVGGLLHFMLPESLLDPALAESNPWTFADTGIPLLLEKAGREGAARRRLVVSVAGGAQVIGDASRFNIGRRNCLAVRKALGCLGMVIDAEVTGGRDSRTLRLEIGSGRLLMRTDSGAERIL
jgi:chemotaxis protein CheD